MTLSLLPAFAFAQGTDGTAAERDLMVLAELLVGRWDNGEQAMFEPRVKVPVADRHPHNAISIERVSVQLNRVKLRLTSGYGRPVDLVVTPNDATSVKVDDGTCAVIFRRESGQFRGDASTACPSGYPYQTMMVAPDRLWTGKTGAVPTKYLRATQYQCFVDMPGASGGKAIPYKRIDGLQLWDDGVVSWFDSPETPSRRLGLQLRKVQWQINNAPGVFARDSLTIYLVEEVKGSEPKTLLYAWTTKGAARVGVNGMWALANCAREAMTSAKPEF